MNGLTTDEPVKAPRLARLAEPDSDIRSMSVEAAARARSAATSSACSGVVSSSTSGCSGATTAYVMPNEVSGRVVKTRRASRSPPSDPSRPSTTRSNSAPSDRPIQLRCMVLTRSGHSSSSSPASSSSA